MRVRALSNFVAVEEFALDELRAALELATDEELQLLTEILFRRKFNPLDYVYTPEPLSIQSQERQTWLDSLEERFRFLAADGVTVLRGKTDQVSYRQILLRVCRYLHIPYHQTLATAEIEAEIFLHLLDRAWRRLPASEQSALARELQRTISEIELAEQLPPAPHNDPVSLLVKGGSALAVTSIVRPLILQLLSRQFAMHTAAYQVARQTVQGGAAIASQIQSRAALQTAYRSMSLSAARYGTVRSIFAFLGPAMWAWFVADLGWRAIATNYGRVIPVVFTLAQIRLTRAECFGSV